MTIGYARVSTNDQSLDLQIDALKKASCQNLYREQISGSKSNRPELNAMMMQLREGDVVIVWEAGSPG